jgi:hypothetical protein
MIAGIILALLAVAGIVLASPWPNPARGCLPSSGCRADAAAGGVRRYCRATNPRALAHTATWTSRLRRPRFGSRAVVEYQHFRQVGIPERHRPVGPAAAPATWSGAHYDTYGRCPGRRQRQRPWPSSRPCELVARTPRTCRRPRATPWRTALFGTYSDRAAPCTRRHGGGPGGLSDVIVLECRLFTTNGSRATSRPCCAYLPRPGDFIAVVRPLDQALDPGSQAAMRNHRPPCHSLAPLPSSGHDLSDT